MVTSGEHCNVATMSFSPPAKFNFFTDIVVPLSSNRGGMTALTAFDEFGAKRRFSFSEIAELGYTAGNALAAAGAGPSKVVMTLQGSTPEWIAAMLGAWRIGAVVLPCSEMLRAKDLEQRLRLAQPAVVVVAERDRQELEAALGMCDEKPTLVEAVTSWPQGTNEPDVKTVATAAEDPSLIIFTSGTTAEPRPAVHLQRYLWGQWTQSKHWLDVRPDDVVWCTAGTGWSKSSRNVFVAPWIGGASAVVHDGRFDPVERLDLIDRAGVTVLCQAPTEYRIIAKRYELDRDKLGSLRHLVSAGEPLNPEVIRTFRDALDLEIHDGYGQTETGALTSMPPDEPVREGSMGKPLPGFELDVRDGELWVKSDSLPTLFDGYWGNDRFEEEWYKTGDRVSMDEDGYLWFEGRSDDVIISAGYRIGPFEVESALIEHSAVTEAAAVSAPDEERGAVVKAFVVLREGKGSAQLVEELQGHVKSITAPYKYPRQIEFIDELPKTASGKIKRGELRMRCC